MDGKNISLRHNVIATLDFATREIFEARLEETASGEIQITVYKLQKGEWVRRFYDTDWPLTDEGERRAMERAEYVLYSGKIAMMEVLLAERRD